MAINRNRELSQVASVVIVDDEKENKKQEYSVEVESAEPPSATDETEIEIPEKKKTFEIFKK